MAERLWAPWRLEYVQADHDGGGCVFCTAAACDDLEGALVIHRGTRALALLNLYPYAHGHVMVAPLRHVADPGALDSEERAEMWDLLDRSLRALTTAMAPDGFNTGMNLGRVAGAGIEHHLHLHVVPRWSGDTNFMPVLADVRVMPEHLSRTLETVRAAWV